jgi:hypothetical protein
MSSFDETRQSNNQTLRPSFHICGDAIVCISADTVERASRLDNYIRAGNYSFLGDLLFEDALDNSKKMSIEKMPKLNISSLCDQTSINRAIVHITGKAHDRCPTESIAKLRLQLPHYKIIFIFLKKPWWLSILKKNTGKTKCSRDLIMESSIYADNLIYIEAIPSFKTYQFIMLTRMDLSNGWGRR